jgi:pimeloyl-ACP methyl ester carboxylesterase
VSFVIERVRLSPVVVGPSLGALTARSLDAERPDLVRCPLVVDGSPAAGSEGAEDAARDIRVALRQWPAPFAAQAAAERFLQGCFGGKLVPAAWADPLGQPDGGWWPRFDVVVMARSCMPPS